MKTKTATKSRDVLLQTRVPAINAEALRHDADAEGLTDAAFLRRLVIKATSTSIEKPRTAEMVRDVSYDFGECPDRLMRPGLIYAFKFGAPHSFRLDEIAFDDDYLIRVVQIGNFWALGNNQTRIPTTDWPGRRVALAALVDAGLVIGVLAETEHECEFNAKLVGKRAAVRTRDETSKALIKSFGTAFSHAYPDVLSIGGEVVLPGETKEFRVHSMSLFRCDRILTDNHNSFALEGAEIGRDPQIGKSMKLRHDTPLPMVAAERAEEIRIFVKNTSKMATVFSARLHGLIVL